MTERVRVHNIISQESATFRLPDQMVEMDEWITEVKTHRTPADPDELCIFFSASLRGVDKRDDIDPTTLDADLIARSMPNMVAWNLETEEKPVLIDE